MGRLFFLFVFLTLNFGLTAQSYIREFSPPGSNRSTIKVMHLEDDHYLLFRTIAEEGNDQKANRLQIIEYDYCGVINSREIHFAGSWYIQMINDVYMAEDSIRIALWSYSPINMHQVPALLSIHPENYDTSYKEIQGKNVMYSYAITPYLNDQYIIQGFVSYTDRPSEYVLLKVDRNFNILKYYQNYGSGSATGGCVVRGSEIYLFTNNHIVKFTSQLEPIWSKETTPQFYISSPTLLTDGIAFALGQYSNERQAFVGKIDFSGNLMWKSNSIGHQNELSQRIRFHQNPDGNLSLLKQEWSPDLGYGPIVVANIDAEKGEVLNEWELDQSVAGEGLRLQHFLPEPEGGVLCALTTDYNAVVVKYNLSNEDENCAMIPVDLQQPSLAYTITAEDTRPNKEGPFEHAVLNYAATDTEVNMEEFCKTDLPSFELLDEEFSICGEKELTVNLSPIPFATYWNDGSQEKIRTLTEPGKYRYSYEICDQLYGEEIDITNEACPCDWYIPNVFSPGTGTDNDEYRIFNNCQGVNNFSILIYNRWGGLMFSSEDPNFRWDGTWKGKKLQSGVFVYLMNYEDPESSGEQTEQGTIVLLR